MLLVQFKFVMLKHKESCVVCFDCSNNLERLGNIYFKNV